MTAQTVAAPLSYEAARRARKQRLQDIDAHWAPRCERLRQKGRDALAVIDRQFWAVVAVNSHDVLYGPTLRAHIAARFIEKAIRDREAARREAVRVHLGPLAAAEIAWDKARGAFDFGLGES